MFGGSLTFTKKYLNGKLTLFVENYFLNYGNLKITIFVNVIVLNFDVWVYRVVALMGLTFGMFYIESVQSRARNNAAISEVLTPSINTVL